MKHIKRIIKMIISPIYRISLKKRDFSIISNNCWGGFYYDKYHLKYLTPTIGLFFHPKDYLKFLSNLDYYLSLSLCEQVKPYNSIHYDMLLRKQQNGWISNLDNLVIGSLGDIEVYFLHYKSFEDASKKWNRRKLRINLKNLIVKFNDQNEFEEEDFVLFSKLPFENKIFFTSNPKYKHIISKEVKIVYEPKYCEKYGFIFDDMHVKKFDFTKYINEIK